MSRGDAMISATATTALVLATAQSNKDDYQIAKLDELGLKRKSRWSEMSIPKKGRRWGLPDDVPYKPLSYIDMPVGLAEREVDQFLREQRLEDLVKKVKNNELEDCDPDIRAPSPPPIFDKNGVRINTREIRIRKAMNAELNRLVRYMLKNVKDYIPPPGWKPQKLAKKFIIPLDKYPTAPFMGVIIGPRGVNHKRLQEETKCRIVIRGKDITDKWQSEEEMSMPQHVHVEGDTEEQIEHAERLVKPLLNPESEPFQLARDAGMEQLAAVNGFSILKTEQRCGICGAMGHLGFECPENNIIDYKMADVTCSICGDKGHVSMDCPENMRKHQEENRDWKAEAEKKREMEKSYADMMSELGMGAPSKPKVEPGYAGPIGAKLEGVQDGPGDNDYNKDMTIPANLAGRFIGPQGSAVKAMSASTGCDIRLEPELGSATNRHVVIRGPPGKREVGKKAVENWVRTQRSVATGGGKSQPSGTQRKNRESSTTSWKFGNPASDITFGGGPTQPKSSPQQNRQMNRPGISSSKPPSSLPPGVRVLGRDPPPLPQRQGDNNSNPPNRRFDMHNDIPHARFDNPGNSHFSRSNNRGGYSDRDRDRGGYREDRGYRQDDRYDGNRNGPDRRDRYNGRDMPPDRRTNNPYADIDNVPYNRGLGNDQGNPLMDPPGGYQGPNIRAVPLNNHTMQPPVPKGGPQQQLPTTAKWTPGGMAP